ncbi:Double-strand break repair protein mre11a, partial [Irineochytrium annulatum]
ALPGSRGFLRACTRPPRVLEADGLLRVGALVHTVLEPGGLDREPAARVPGQRDGQRVLERPDAAVGRAYVLGPAERLHGGRVGSAAGGDDVHERGWGVRHGCAELCGGRGVWIVDVLWGGDRRGGRNGFDGARNLRYDRDSRVEAVGRAAAARGSRDGVDEDCRVPRRWREGWRGRGCRGLSCPAGAWTGRGVDVAGKGKFGWTCRGGRTAAPAAGTGTSAPSRSGHTGATGTRCHALPIFASAVWKLKWMPAKFGFKEAAARWLSLNAVENKGFLGDLLGLSSTSIASPTASPTVVSATSVVDAIESAAGSATASSDCTLIASSFFQSGLQPWKPASDCCTWSFANDTAGIDQKVVCESGRVTALLIGRMLGEGLVSGIPDAVGSLTNLKQLDLSWNGFTTITNNWTGLTNLQYLDIQSNLFNAQSFPSSLLTLKNLDYLTFDDSSMSGPMPSLEGLTNLRTCSVAQSLCINYVDAQAFKEAQPAACRNTSNQGNIPQSNERFDVVFVDQLPVCSGATAYYNAANSFATTIAAATTSSAASGALSPLADVGANATSGGSGGVTVPQHVLIALIVVLLVAVIMAVWLGIVTLLSRRRLVKKRRYVELNDDQGNIFRGGGSGVASSAGRRGGAFEVEEDIYEEDVDARSAAAGTAGSSRRSLDEAQRSSRSGSWGRDGTAGHRTGGGGLFRGLFASAPREVGERRPSESSISTSFGHTHRESFDDLRSTPEPVLSPSSSTYYETPQPQPQVSSSQYRPQQYVSEPRNPVPYRPAPPPSSSSPNPYTDRMAQASMHSVAPAYPGPPEQDSFSSPNRPEGGTAHYVMSSTLMLDDESEGSSRAPVPAYTGDVGVGVSGGKSRAAFDDSAKSAPSYHEELKGGGGEVDTVGASVGKAGLHEYPQRDGSYPGDREKGGMLRLQPVSASSNGKVGKEGMLRLPSISSSVESGNTEAEVRNEDDNDDQLALQVACSRQTWPLNITMALRILIATDNHLGYMERDPVRGGDSFDSFEEILQIATEREVDFILLGGDLFHDNKPSRKCMHRTMYLLRKYCMGSRPCAFDFLSAQDEVFKDSFHTVNYQDPNYNVSLPVFSIHGNHDDPSGDGDLCALDLLSVTGLVNYFGRQLEVDDIKISPILLQKGDVKVGLYGLGNIRDERLYRTFAKKKVQMFRPKVGKDDWVNIFVLHQNRVKHGPTNYIPESFLDNFLDIVLWGHEHECLIDFFTNEEHGFYITQPGSSVATSLCEGEAKEKHVGIIEILPNKEFRLDNIRLKTVRPFVIDEVVLSKQSSLRGAKEREVFDYLTEKIEELINKAKNQWMEQNPDVEEDKFPRPLIRLRVEYSNFSTINPQRFGQQFVDKVANVKDILQFYRKRSAPSKESRPAKMEDVSMPEALNKIQMNDLVNEYLAQQNLDLLPENGIGDAVKVYVEKEEKEAIADFVNKSLKKAQKSIESQYIEQPDALNDDSLAKDVKAVDVDEEGNAELAPPAKAARATKRKKKTSDDDEDEDEEFEDRQSTKKKYNLFQLAQIMQQTKGCYKGESTGETAGEESHTAETGRVFAV